MVVSGLGRNLFSVPEATAQGITTIFALHDSRIEATDFVLLLTQVRGARNLYSFNMDVEEQVVALQANGAGVGGAHAQ